MLIFGPAQTDHQGFFVAYRNDKCTKQPVNTNTFDAMPKNIATFLGLPDSSDFARRCFQKSSVQS